MKNILRILGALCIGYTICYGVLKLAEKWVTCCVPRDVEQRVERVGGPR